jgi:predicted ATP-dependent serine protease
MATKICNICGYSLEDYVTECSNCKGHDFDTTNKFLYVKKSRKSKYDQTDAW